MGESNDRLHANQSVPLNTSESKRDDTRELEAHIAELNGKLEKQSAENRHGMTEFTKKHQEIYSTFSSSLAKKDVELGEGRRKIDSLRSENEKLKTIRNELKLKIRDLVHEKESAQAMNFDVRS